MNNKYLQILNVSNPSLVLQRAEDLFGPEAIIKLSTRKKKKYMIYLNGKFHHFGDINYEDYTKTLDEEQRADFRLRNADWNNRAYYSPAFLSFNLLW